MPDFGDLFFFSFFFDIFFVRKKENSKISDMILNETSGGRHYCVVLTENPYASFKPS